MPFSLPPNLLADRDLGTYLITAIVVLSWIVGIASQLINKYKARKQQQADARPAPPRPSPPPVPPELAAERIRLEHRRAKEANRRQQAPQRQPASATPRGQRANRRPAHPAKPPAVTPQQTAPAPPTAPVTDTEIRGTPTAEAHAGPRRPAPPIRALLRPETLRHQFILTEILQPPLALREDPAP